MPEQVQKSTEPSASQVRTDSSQTNRNKVAEDSRTRDAGRLGSCGGAGVQICSYCRRKAYARVCFGIQVVLTRWQEWCVPFLSHWHLHSAASVMALVEADMMRFLGAMCVQQRALCRTAAGYQVGRNSCKCPKLEKMQTESEALTRPYCSSSLPKYRNSNKKRCIQDKRCPTKNRVHKGGLGRVNKTNTYHVAYKYRPGQLVGCVRQRFARSKRDTKHKDPEKKSMYRVSKKSASKVHYSGSYLSSPVATFDPTSVTKTGRGCVPESKGPAVGERCGLKSLSNYDVDKRSLYASTRTAARKYGSSRWNIRQGPLQREIAGCGMQKFKINPILTRWRNARWRYRQVPRTERGVVAWACRWVGEARRKWSKLMRSRRKLGGNRYVEHSPWLSRNYTKVHGKRSISQARKRVMVFLP